MSEDLTELLAEAGADPAKRARLFARVYDELRQIARRELGSRDADSTLDTRPLVHEAYFKLFPTHGGARFENRRHFFGAAARAMRQVAIEHARARLAERRGAGQRPVDLTVLAESVLRVDSEAENLVRLDEALTQLGEVDARALEVAELRFFAGLEVGEIAAMLGVSEPTVKRDARFVREFLAECLSN
ncbi:MAG: sigma-70 family RNA polymerase sigma factor [Gammaproteobacteria bacterium]|nr:MAG: sigma-70 family RNA polymerase sigma factor [Gammaproteobacteria bacterium]